MQAQHISAHCKPRLAKKKRCFPSFSIQIPPEPAKNSSLQTAPQAADRGLITRGAQGCWFSCPQQQHQPYSLPGQEQAELSPPLSLPGIQPESGEVLAKPLGAARTSPLPVTLPPLPGNSEYLIRACGKSPLSVNGWGRWAAPEMTTSAEGTCCSHCHPWVGTEPLPILILITARSSPNCSLPSWEGRQTLLKEPQPHGAARKAEQVQ